MHNKSINRVLSSGLKVSTQASFRCHLNTTFTVLAQQILVELFLVKIGFCHLHQLKFQEL